jgi:alanyl-tRNA synthetase
VRVVQVPGFSQELCGGCHVKATGDIGLLTITSESGIATGVRRIVALTGEAAEAHLRRNRQIVEQFRLTLNAPPEELPARLEALIEERKRLERELRAARKGSLTDDAAGLLARAQERHGVRVLAAQVQAGSMDELRALADALRRGLQRGVAVLGAEVNGKATLLCVVSEELVRGQAKAGEIVNRVAALADGRGGGPPHMATAGAKDPGKLGLALEQAPALIDAYLAELRV